MAKRFLASTGPVVRKIIDSARRGEFDYNPRPVKKINWTAYDLAQTRELADTLEFIQRFVDKAATRIAARKGLDRPGRGRPPANPSDVAKVLLAQAYFGVPNRVAEGFLYLFAAKLGLHEEFSYKTIERGYDRATVNEILDEVVELTNLPVKALEKVFAVDGTGMSTAVRDNYRQTRERQRSKAGKKADGSWPEGHHDFVYTVGIIGVEYKLYAALTSTTDHRRGEVSFFPSLMDRATAIHPEMAMILGDGAYAGRPHVRVAEEHGVVPRFLPRRNVTLKRMGVKAWGDMLLDMAEDPQKWFTEYHPRSIAETGNFMTKNRRGKLRKRLPERRCTESNLRLVEHNVRRMVMLRYLVGIVPLSPGVAG